MMEGRGRGASGRTGRLLLGAAVVLGGVVAKPAGACECPKASLIDGLASADVVFVGSLVGREGHDGSLALLKPKTILKGPRLTGRVKVEDGAYGLCTYRVFNAGSGDYLVYANLHATSEPLTTPLVCPQTTLVERVRPQFEALIRYAHQHRKELRTNERWRQDLP